MALTGQLAKMLARYPRRPGGVVRAAASGAQSRDSMGNMRGRSTTPAAGPSTPQTRAHFDGLSVAPRRPQISRRDRVKGSPRGRRARRSPGITRDFLSILRARPSVGAAGIWGRPSPSMLRFADFRTSPPSPQVISPCHRECVWEADPAPRDLLRFHEVQMQLGADQSLIFGIRPAGASFAPTFVHFRLAAAYSRPRSANAHGNRRRRSPGFLAHRRRPKDWSLRACAPRLWRLS